MYVLKANQHSHSQSSWKASKGETMKLGMWTLLWVYARWPLRCKDTVDNQKAAPIAMVTACINVSKCSPRHFPDSHCGSGGGRIPQGGEPHWHPSLRSREHWEGGGRWPDLPKRWSWSEVCAVPMQNQSLL